MSAQSLGEKPNSMWKEATSRLSPVALTFAKPGGLAWTLVLTLAGCAWLLRSTAAGQMWSAVIVASTTLLLATARSWRGCRRTNERISLVAGITLVGLFIVRTPPTLQIGLTPVLLTLTVLVVLSWHEWRFAPDHGQEGIYWAVAESARGTLWAGLGMSVAMMANAIVDPECLWLHTLLFGGGALVGRNFGLLVAPTCYAANSSLDSTRLTHKRGSIEDPSSSADWWKGVQS